MDDRKILVLGTGGTIAGTAAVAGDNVGYQAGQLAIDVMLEALPALEPAVRSRLRGEQLAQIDSKDMDFDLWQRVAARCQAAQQDPSVAAVVIAHGTDTLEETAWFLNEVLLGSKPVVFTSAMRPASAVTPDGPQNLLDALAVATWTGASGVLAVMAGVIHGARHVRKSHPYRVDAFDSGESGPVGWVEEGCVRLNRPWPVLKEGTNVGFGESAATMWPRVEIVLSYAGASGATVDALVRDGVAGLVVAGTGNGTVHRSLEAALLSAVDRGVRVVRTTRCTQGQIVVRSGDGAFELSDLPAVKARISLMLDLWRQSRRS